MNIFKAELDTIHQNGVIGPITQFGQCHARVTDS